LRIFYRNTTLTSFFYKTVLFIYKGTLFTRIVLDKYNAGCKLGALTLTRKPFNFPKKKKKKKR